MNSVTESTAQPRQPLSVVDVAMDALLCEYARCETDVDERFVQGVLRQLRDSIPAAGLPPVRRRPWLWRVLPLAAAAAAAVVVLAIVIWPPSMRCLGGRDTQCLVDREMEFQAVAGRVLARHLSQTHPGARILVLKEPVGPGQRPNPMLDGFLADLAPGCSVVGTTSLAVPPEKLAAWQREVGDAGTMLPPVEYWYTAAWFDTALKPYLGRFDLVVTLIGLPQDWTKSALLHADDAPRVAILNGSIYDLAPLLRRGLVTAAVTYSPKAVYDDRPVPRDLEAAFARRFMLITPQNLDAVQRTQPDLFRLPK